MFVEIPITIHNSPMAAALMAEIEPPTIATQQDFDRCGQGLKRRMCGGGQVVAGLLEWVRVLHNGLASFQ